MSEQPFDVLVINLDRSPDRLSLQKNQASRLGYSFTRIAAVDGAVVEDAVYARLKNGWQRPMLRNEIACLLSHQKAWEYCAFAGRPAVILEDDALLATCFVAGTRELLNSPDFKAGFVNFETRPVRKTLAARASFGLEDGTQFFEIQRDKGGSAGYLVTPTAAKALLKGLLDRPAPADAYLNRPRTFTRLQVDPAWCVADDILPKFSVDLKRTLKSDASTISVRRKSAAREDLKIAPGLWVLFKSRRFAETASTWLRTTFGSGGVQKRTVRPHATFMDTNET